MSPVSVLVPWSGSCPHRAAAWQYVQSWYRIHHPDWQVVRGESGDGPWCKAGAVADALSRADGEILVIADADCIAPALEEAVEAIVSGSQWAMPHHLVHRFSRQATSSILGGTPPEHIVRSRLNYTQMPYAGYPGGGVAVISREAYTQVPLDPRFLGWGQEDEAWATALGCLYGPPWRRRAQPLWHLWHPPQIRLTRSTGSEASRSLLHQYRRRRTDQAGMAAHLEPARRLVAAAS